MPDMKEDLQVSDAWVDLHTAVGVTAGAALTIQNKGVHPIVLFISESQPAANSRSGFKVNEDEVWSYPANSGTLWVRSMVGVSSVCAQEA